jgi:hypothetical protein
MTNRISKIPNDVQDRNSEAWKKLCVYIDRIAENNIDKLVPREELGDELFAQIYTLPETISKLKKVTKVGLYCSNLKRIPPEIGQMESLEYFDPYTSYDLHWFPYEITKCKIKDSRISTRALYGNYKNRMGFPRLDHNPVKYEGDIVKCSVCEKEMTYEETNQLWITLRIGTDTVPLLTNLCSKECEQKLPRPSKNYIQYPHKGGVDLAQPPNENELWEKEWEKRQKEMKETKSTTQKHNNSDEKVDIKKWKSLKLIRRIWGK